LNFKTFKSVAIIRITIVKYHFEQYVSYIVAISVCVIGLETKAVTCTVLMKTDGNRLC